MLYNHKIYLQSHNAVSIERPTDEERPSSWIMDPIVGQAGVSLATAASGDSKSKKQNGKAVVSSAEPAKCAGQPEDSLPTAISGDSKSMKSNDKAVVSSADPVKRARQHGVSLAIAVFDVPNSKKLNGKAVVSTSDEVLFFKDVKFGPQEGELSAKFGSHNYVGHVKLVNEKALSDSLVLDEVEIASSRRILVHVQTRWSCHEAVHMGTAVFCEKFKALGKPPTVIDHIGHIAGALSLSYPSSSRVFFDMDVQATREYLAWFESNTEVANRVNAEIVAKAETATIGELLSYMKQVAWFECTSTIDDIVRDSAWYYIACGGCKTKVTKGPTTLMCKKCGKTEIVGAAEYLTKLSVYDNNDHASFVLLGDAGRELTRMKASELANESVGDDYVVPVPPSLTDSIGQTRTFVIKVSKHNLDGKTQSLTVTKVLPLKVPELEGNLDEDVEEEPADEKDGAADGTVKRNSDGIESGETKRAKCG
ncbi:hypothetical protein F2Q69_00009703 [Brassica cretica]|uniref:Replication factor A C-terminal domain-containing protein n=1 Tax=Brassica cretica TaxID=69181 RepID=A0A8S9PB65_BRACR|nr:hypothetical protein F2Q69_00009703 [Brassica cretica]